MQLAAMEKSSILRFTFIFAIIFFLFAYSFYPSSKSEFLGSSPCFPWCTSKNRIYSNFDSILENPVHKGTHHHHSTLHPLDPLSVKEINKVRTILSSHAHFASSFPTIHSLVLDEPNKTQVLAWNKGDPLPPRKAFAIVLLNGQSHMLTVDLNLGQVISHAINSGSGYPALTMDDISAALKVTLADAEFNKSIISRVDLDQKKIVKFSNTGRGIPIPKSSNTDYRYTAQVKPPELKPLNPMSIEQPKGPSFIVEDGHVVKWSNWVFHLKADQQAGMVISRATVQDSESGELRSVMYKGFSSELSVPYMDPDEHW
ncbi:hypothetical protein Patl1_18613 [Pistacia atlantica]|uniref:Uncharacterized protein n=1 Tax=Pistacia atlantica TaxID=434234 RepID=A0ACC1C1Q8_9ROSI|nr:hypothetical protein Patl1_18613 [Pistacia atlantica]